MRLRYVASGVVLVVLWLWSCSAAAATAPRFTVQDGVRYVVSELPGRVVDVPLKVGKFKVRGVAPSVDAVSLVVATASGLLVTETSVTGSSGRFSLPLFSGEYRFWVVAADGSWVSEPRDVFVYGPGGVGVSSGGFKLFGSRWDPCRPISWSYDPSGGYADGFSDVARSFSFISRASGLKFVYTTDSDADIEVSWSSAEVTSGLEGKTVGVGGYSFVTGKGASDGFVILDAEDRGRYGISEGSSAFWQAVMLHELSHAVGLDHVDDESALMFPSTSSRNLFFEAGDVAGLVSVGVLKGCVA